MTVVFATGGPALVALLTDIPSVRAAALTFLPFAAVLPVVSVWAFVLDGLFFGATRTSDLRNATVAAGRSRPPAATKCAARRWASSVTATSAPRSA